MSHSNYGIKVMSLLLVVALILVGCRRSESQPTEPRRTVQDFSLGLVIGLIRVFVIPGILIGMFGLSIFLVMVAETDKYQATSSRFALALGLAGFVLVVILSRFTGFLVPQQPLNVFQHIWPYIIGGFITGVALIAAFHSFLKSRAISILILVLSCTSLSALYFYVFVNELRDALLVSTVSLLVGSLAYVVLFPKVIDDLSG